MAYVHPGRMFVERFGRPKGADDVIRYAGFLRDEAGLTAAPPVDLARIYGRFEIPMPERISLPNQQGLLLDHSGLIIVNRDDAVTRQRFTEAHELIEFLFAAVPHNKSQRKDKETLCNLGAAELLMPRRAFALRVFFVGVSFKAACRLAVEFQVSVTAALVRMVQVGPDGHAAVLWRMKNKQTELRAKPSGKQPATSGDMPGEPAPKKLRVEWAFSGPGVPYIPRGKSVGEDTSICAAWQSQVFTTGRDNLDLGTVKGMFKCENQPFERERGSVLSLLHCPGDDRCGPSRA